MILSWTHLASRFSSEGKYAIRAVIARLDLGKDGMKAGPQLTMEVQ